MTNDLEDLYKEIILDHYRRPRNRGTLPEPPAQKAHGYNPLCGDEITIYVDVNNNAIKDIKIDGKGCAISQSSASMMSELVKNKSLPEFDQSWHKFKEMLEVEKVTQPGADSESGEGYDANAPAGSQLADAEALRSVRQFPARIKCATLAWNTLSQILHRQGETFVES